MLNKLHLAMIDLYRGDLQGSQLRKIYRGNREGG